MDQHLSGELTGKSVIKKTNARLKFLYRQCKFLNPEIRKMLCNALIQCNFDYACSSWYSSLTKGTKTKLQICQNKMVRFINNMSYREHIGPSEINNIGWLTVENRIEQLKLNHVHKIINEKAPPYMLNNFKRTNQLHCHRTRNSAFSFIVPRVNSNAYNSFYYTSIKSWNSLPAKLQSMTCYNSFKKNVKLFIVSRTKSLEQSIYVFY